MEQSNSMKVACFLAALFTALGCSSYATLLFNGDFEIPADGIRDVSGNGTGLTINTNGQIATSSGNPYNGVESVTFGDWWENRSRWGNNFPSTDTDPINAGNSTQFAQRSGPGPGNWLTQFVEGDGSAGTGLQLALMARRFRRNTGQASSHGRIQHEWLRQRSAPDIYRDAPV